MKKLPLSLLLIGTIFNNTANACSVCACSASNQYLGILPQSKSNFAGLQYHYRTYNSMHHPDAGEVSGITSTEVYQTLQVSGRYSVTDRIQLFAFVPYISNARTESGKTTSVNGVGDITVLVNYKFNGIECTGKNWQHTLIAGGGTKLPTGKYDANAVKYEDGMPNMQPGTSTFDFIANVNYTIQYKRAGVNTDVSYTATTTNADKYKFGNRLATGLLFFYSLNLKSLKLVPQLGSRFEFSGSDYDNYSKRIKNDMSGGSHVYGTIGMQVYYKSVGVQAMFHQPLYQNYAGGMVNNKYKTEAGIYFLF